MQGSTVIAHVVGIFIFFTYCELHFQISNHSTIAVENFSEAQFPSDKWILGNWHQAAPTFREVDFTGLDLNPEIESRLWVRIRDIEYQRTSDDAPNSARLR